jgi:superfamily I DNA/RNA helicase/mRNA-degrading endonuclease RelE of RelBE toxin-antitoxin system
MQFVIANTFQDSLARLTGDEQKAVKTAAFDLQLNPSHPSLQMHKLDKAKDPRFWSIRVSRDMRLIVHRTAGSLLLCYVDHHDQAYEWAERRKLETHPTTGAAQLVEIRERVHEISIPKYVETPTTKPLLFKALTEEELLRLGVPHDWLPDVQAATEDNILEIAQHLPAEAAEGLLTLATGGKLPEPVFVGRAKTRDQAFTPDAMPALPNPFVHPDAQRRFRVMSNMEELAQALEYPWEKWAVFLHPAQRQLVEKDFKGPAKVAGSAGTGKTIVALHRAVHLARANPDSRVLLTTFSDMLANALRTRLRLLIGSQPRLGEQIEVLSMKAVGLRLYELNLGKPKLISVDRLRRMMQEASDAITDHKFTLRFLMSEWEQVVDAWQLSSWEDYRDVTRLGRKTRLKEPQRLLLWSIFDAVRTRLFDDGSMTEAGMFERLAAHYASGTASPFDFAVVDEAQDVSITQLRFLAALGGKRTNGLFFAGDTGQRIFQQPFSWKGLGVDLRGRSTTLKVNYRTSHQIRMQADRLLDTEVADVDGNIEDRTGTVSLFDGPVPQVLNANTEALEQEEVAKWLRKRISDGLRPDEIVIFVRSAAELPRAELAATVAGLSFRVLDTHAETTGGSLSLSTMHLAKGLEFRAVAVMACDDEVIPLQERIETATDASELEDVYNTERQLLYVACTRARDCLLLTSAGSPSEFLQDMQSRRVGRT